MHLTGARGEDSYKDAVPLSPQIAERLDLPASFVTGVIGTIDPARAVRTERAFVAAFFDRSLRAATVISWTARTPVSQTSRSSPDG